MFLPLTMTEQPLSSLATEHLQGDRHWELCFLAMFFALPLVELRAAHGIEVVHPEAIWSAR